MDIRVLKYFLEIVKTGNITKAAENLHITQPTLSRQIMDLEEEVGAKLFDRGKRKVALTDKGITYYRYAQDIVSTLEKAQSEMASTGDETTGVLAIGCVETKAAVFLMDVINQFHKKYPKVQYEFYNAYSDDIKNRLDANKLDIGILINPVEAAKYDYIELPIEEPWGFLFHKDDIMASRERVTLHEMADYPLIITSRTIVIDEIKSWLGVKDHGLNIFATHNLLTNTLPLIESGTASTLTVEGAFHMREQPNLTFVPLEPPRTSTHVVAWKKSRQMNPLAELFLEDIDHTFQASLSTHYKY